MIFICYVTNHNRKPYLLCYIIISEIHIICISQQKLFWKICIGQWQVKFSFKSAMLTVKSADWCVTISVKWNKQEELAPADSLS